MDTRHHIITFLFAIFPIAAISQELKIQSFIPQENEIIPSNERKTDFNGVNCALVKVEIVDSLDRVEGNIIGDIDTRGMEKRIYLTQGTKFFRLHPHNHFPVSITTSEFGIERLESNRVYILRLTEPNKEEKPEPVPKDPGPTDTIHVNTSSSSASEFHVHVYAGLGFNALSTMGPSVLVGASYGMFSLEGGFVYGLDKVEDIRLSISNTINEAFDYSCSKVWVRLGASFDMKHFRITPQAGVTFNMISGKTASGASNSTDYFKDSNPMSAFAAVRFSYEVADHLRIHLTPQYDFSIGGDEIFEVIKQGDSKIKAWGEGFGINAGIIYEF